MKVSIGKAAEELGVTRETLRRWEHLGKITSERTKKGHRRYDLGYLRGISPKKNFDKKYTIAYARVSSHDQKEDLKRQVAVLESFRFYGARSRKNKKIVETLRNVAKEL